MQLPWPFPPDLLPTEFSTNEWMMIWGGGLILLGYLISWWSSRYDLEGAAWSSAWQLATGGRTKDNKTEIENKITNISSAKTVTGKAGRAAGTVIGHLFAKLMGLVSLVLMLAGAVLAAVGYFWR